MMYTIIAIALFVVFFLIALKRKSIVDLSAMALCLVCNAEDTWGGGTGAIKYSEVYKQLAEYVPTILKPFITEKVIKDIIEKAKTEMDNIIKEQLEKQEAEEDDTEAEENTEDTEGI